jgi:hypothetical protein
MALLLRLWQKSVSGILLESKARPVRKADLTAICELII